MSVASKVPGMTLIVLSYKVTLNWVLGTSSSEGRNMVRTMEPFTPLIPLAPTEEREAIHPLRRASTRQLVLSIHIRPSCCRNRPTIQFSSLKVRMVFGQSNWKLSFISLSHC